MNDDDYAIIRMASIQLDDNINPIYCINPYKTLIVAIIHLAMLDLFYSDETTMKKSAVFFFNQNNPSLQYYCDFLDDEYANAELWRQKAREIIRNPGEVRIEEQLSIMNRKEYQKWLNKRKSQNKIQRRGKKNKI